MRIDYKLIDLACEKIKDVNHSYIEFDEISLKQSLRYHSDETKNDYDESLGWDEDKFHAIDIFILKKSITGIYKKWILTSKAWRVSIIIIGFTQDIDIYFKRESEATDILEKLINWLAVK